MNDDAAIEYWIVPIADHSNWRERRFFDAVLPDLRDYIWQNEPFKLAVKEDPLPHFYGVTNYGDNVDDEWFIIYLLFKISRLFSDFFIQVRDTDGEILLIEAADVLPTWIERNARFAENRVFIWQGKVHIVSPSVLSKYRGITRRFDSEDEDVRYLKWSEMKELCSKAEANTQAADPVQAVIGERINRYPERISESFHHAKCYLPRIVAIVLQQFPQLVSAAVRAFYLRDPVGLKACHSMSTIEPKDFQLTRVRFTRCLFAQISQQKFRSVSQKWKSALENVRSNDPLKFDAKAWELGMKLTCGFEILCSLYARSKASTNESDGRLNNAASKSDQEWQKFLAHLRSLGYFRENIEGSQEYVRLANTAREYYLMSCHSNEGVSIYDNPGAVIYDLISKNPPTNEGLVEQLETLSPDDDEGWLTPALTCLDDLHETKRNGSTAAEEASASQSESSAIVEQIETFLGAASSFEGAAMSRTAPSVKQSSSKTNFIGETLTNSIDKILADLRKPREERRTSESSARSSEMDSYSGEESDIELSEGEVRAATMFAQSMKHLMKKMDNELSTSLVTAAPISNSSDAAASAARAMQTEGKERKATPTQFGSTKRAAMTKSPGGDSIDLEDDDFMAVPVRVEKNVVGNLLESYWSEQSAGSPGPASALLRGANISLPKHHQLPHLDSDDDEFDESVLF